MESKPSLKTAKMIALDVSSKCIGCALFDLKDMTLLELTHFTPKAVPKPEDKIEELLKKTDAFQKKLEEYRNMGIVKCVIEEPLLNSNNVYTVATLMRFNSMVCKAIYDTLGVVPNFISTYDARKYAFPELVQPNDKGRKVLFGGYPKGCDKKMIVWELVAKKQPEIVWPYTKNVTLKKEAFDMSDAYTVGVAYVNRLKQKK